MTRSTTVSAYLRGVRPGPVAAYRKAPVAAASVAQLETFACVADDSDSLDGTYLLLYDDAGSVAVWIDTDNSGTAEPSHGADRAIEVTGIATDATPASVATAVAAAIDGDSAFGAAAAGAVVTVTHATAGLRGAGHDDDTGFGPFGVVTAGANPLAVLVATPLVLRQLRVTNTGDAAYLHVFDADSAPAIGSTESLMAVKLDSEASYADLSAWPFERGLVVGLSGSVSSLTAFDGSAKIAALWD